MDIRCPRCGEPWEFDCLHEEVEYRDPHKPWQFTEDRLVSEGVPRWKANDQAYQPYLRKVKAEFQSKGCEALTGYGARCTDPAPDPGAAMVAGALYDLLGDDMDGAASMMQDAGL